MKRSRLLVWVLGVGCLGMVEWSNGRMVAGRPSDRRATIRPSDHSTISKRGAPAYVGTKVCLKCHIKFVKKWPGLPHSKSLTARDPARGGCEDCHGPGRKHSTTDRKAIVRFSELKVARKDEICLKCHAPNVTAANWKKTGHAKQDISCTLCHDVHNPAIPEKMLRVGFDASCRCHGAVREKAASGDHHKLPEGMACTSCHTPHGSPQPAGLIKPKSDLCKGCHGDSPPMPVDNSRLSR